MRILHFADLHLDASFAGSGMSSSMAARRREELRGALRRIMDLALVQKVDAITVGGDLYEQERFTQDTGNFICQQFQRVSPIPVLIAPGNHDPWVPHSLYRQVPWPENVFIFKSPALQARPLGDVAVWGAAHCTPACKDNLIRGVKAPADGVHLLLLHASDIASIPDAKPALCPLTARDVQDGGFDLALLGHYHGARLTPADRPVLCYPGSPEPLGFDELGPRYVLLVEIEGVEKTARLLELESKQYQVLSLDVSSTTTRENIREMVAGLSREKGLDHACVRLHLTGMLQPGVDLSMDGLLADLSEHFAFLLVRDETYPGYDLESLKQDLTVRGAFVRKMASLVENGGADEREVARRALFLGLQALDRRELRPE